MKSNKLSISFYEICILFLIPFLFLFTLRIIGFDGLYGQDSYEYLRYLKVIKEYIGTGAHPKSFYWPVLYPFIGALLSFLIEDNIFSLTLLSCISFFITCLYTLKTIRILYPKTQVSFLYVLIFCSFCPFLLKMGLIVMSDAMAITFVVLSFYFFFLFYYNNTSLIPVFIFITCAFMTRYPSIFVTLPILFFCSYLVIRRKKWKPFIISLFFSFVITIPFIIFQRDELFKATSNSFLNSWSIQNFFSRSHVTVDGVNTYLFPNIVYVFYVFFHPGFIFIGVLLSFFAIKNHKLLLSFPQKLLGISIAIYILFLAGIPFQNPRILALTFPLVLLLFFPFFSNFINTKSIKKFIFPISITAIILQFFLWKKTFNSILIRSNIEKEITVMLKPYQGNTLYSFDLDIAIQGRGLNFEYRNMFISLYKDIHKKDLILFDPLRYSYQWKNKNPMLNWEFIHSNYELKVLETNPNGWKLYEVNSKK
ncbi:glycosyltransferase family 39 protein [Tenacibaculum sp. Bg11-29]|uniref:ArnT family glycosyltransferase n=1 Tax=Tenacibaculum sp. Bg11-29 TaxID=2058306 RepID=UPI0012FE8CE6|nr:glycosyltransferase family 39 protein [Tenacibaculum sp. Bg11-29]